MKVKLTSRNVAAISKTSKKQHHETNAVFWEKWDIILETATNTIKATTQKRVQSPIHPINYSYHTKQHKIQYNTFNCTMYSDTLFTLTESTRGHTMSQVMVTDRDYNRVGHMYTKSEAGDVLLQIFQSVGVL